MTTHVDQGAVHAATPLELAHAFLARGFSVFSVPPPRPGVAPGHPGDGKVPAMPWSERRYRLPTTDEIDREFGGAPMNIAIITGAISGVVVVDADDRAALRWLTRKLPWTPWQTETSKGFHLFYRYPAMRVPNRARIETPDGKLKIDVRGDGGYVIAPGSMHASGVAYREAGDWSEPRARVPVFWPGWLERPRRSMTIATAATVRTITPSAGDPLQRARAYLAAIPRPEIGQGSDAAVHYAACRLSRGFALSASDAESLLWDWAGSRPGWTREWIARKVANAERNGSEPIGALR